jgi:Mg2+/Co2+ transporter CorB
LDPAQKQKPPKDKLFKAPGSVLKHMDFKWAGKMIAFTFTVSISLSLISSYSMSRLGFFAAIIILFLMILMGIAFDIVGLAVATANEAVFHSMASRKVRGSREAVWLIRNADKVSNFCNDVVGDIAGIISGTTAAIIATSFSSGLDLGEAIVQTVVTGIVAGFTVGGKAIGKGIAIGMCNQITFLIGRILSFFHGLRKKGA